MGLISLFFRKKRTQGYIAYFGLETWWISTFSENERAYIQHKFQPLGSSTHGLIHGKNTYLNLSATSFLTNLAGWFSTKNDRHLAHKIINMAEELSKHTDDILDLHFLHSEKIGLCYGDRGDPSLFEQSIQSCRLQISIAESASRAFLIKFEDAPLPSHRGYEQLSIILEKQGLFGEVVELCMQASHQGWAGEWEKRIARCKRKLK